MMMPGSWAIMGSMPDTATAPAPGSLVGHWVERPDLVITRVTSAMKEK